MSRFRQAINNTENNKELITDGVVHLLNGKFARIDKWCFYTLNQELIGSPYPDEMAKFKECVNHGVWSYFVIPRKDFPFAGKFNTTIPLPRPAMKRTWPSHMAPEGFFVLKDGSGELCLYCPWHYFFFQMSERWQYEGYMKHKIVTMTSKLDAVIRFAYGPIETIEIEEKKQEAFDIYEEIEQLQDKILNAERRLDKIDPYRRIQIQFEKVKEKLMKALGTNTHSSSGTSTT